MKKLNLHITKFNIITIMLTLIYISCAHDNQTDPEFKDFADLKKNTQNFKNASDRFQNFGSSNRTYQNLKFEIEKSHRNTISKLKKIGEQLKADKEKENTEIAKIANTQFDFLETFKTSPDKVISKEDRIQLKRIIYSSLNYNTQKIETLKEILEKLNKNPQHQNIVDKFIHKISWGIQYLLSGSLAFIKDIKDGLHTTSLEECEAILTSVNIGLRLKQRFETTLIATIEAYDKNYNNIKTNDEKLASYMNERYKDLDPSNHNSMTNLNKK
ncbi:complement regulator-acquiring protein (plasmid) [Borreliella yangtzensis]|uniref:complement regulator-acquiring protein n=1 Tax=Borreliella yangtzensis TaxID=683292 RepID=UPI003B675221